MAARLRVDQSVYERGRKGRRGCALDVSGQQNGISLELLMQLVNEIDLPLETLHLPCPECEGEYRDRACDDHERAEGDFSCSHVEF